MNSELDKNSLVFDVIWERICKLTGWKKYGQLAEFLCIKPSSVAGAKQRGVISIEWVFKVAQGYNGSTDWLATGKGPMKRGEAAACTVDEPLMESIIEAVEEYLAKVKGTLPPIKKAYLITTLYVMFSTEEEKKVDKATVIRLVKLAV